MRRSPIRGVIGTIFLSTLLVVLVPVIALADDITDIGQSAADQTTQAVNQTADQTTQTVNQTADQTTQTVGQTGGSLTSGGEGSGRLRSGSQEPQSATSKDDVTSGTVASGHTKARVLLTRRAMLPSDSVHLAADRSSVPPADDDTDTTTDPCHQDSSLVCLGLLFGLGGVADTGADVLGVLVRTGSAVVVLAAIALLLAILGAAALTASFRFRLASTRAN